jgi:hypothetical protein
MLRNIIYQNQTSVIMASPSTNLPNYYYQVFDQDLRRDLTPDSGHEIPH